MKEVLTGGRVENRNCVILPGEGPYLFKVLQNDISGRFELRRMERCKYRQEVGCERNFRSVKST